MKSLASFALLLATAGVITAQIPIAGKGLQENLTQLYRQQSPGSDACTSAAAGDSVPDPDDCTKYYYCSAVGIATPDFPLYCGPNFECFDSAASPMVCSDDATACQTACAAAGPSCKYKCTQPNEQIADRTDCNKHYLCDVDSKPVEIHCFDDSPFFNGDSCVTDEAQCCTCRKGTCDDIAAGGSIANPDDCHSFYTCIDPIPNGPTPCPDGGVFDPLTSECDPNNKECSNSCNIGGGGDSTISAQSTASSDILTSAPSLSTSVTTLTTSPSTLSTSTAPTTLTSTTSTATPTTTPGCLDTSDFTCPGHGFYARCPFCDPSYFSCAGVGGSPTQGACSGKLVFNPNPEYPFCMLPENCPV